MMKTVENDRKQWENNSIQLFPTAFIFSDSFRLFIQQVEYVAGNNAGSFSSQASFA